jgi:hypothetical protein
MDMRRLLVGLSVVVAVVLGTASSAAAITWGRPDVNNEYPNVASVRGSSRRRTSLGSAAEGACCRGTRIRS